MKRNEFNFYGRTTIYYLYDKQLDYTFKGVAVCAPEDEYNPEIGMRIAKLKAICKMRDAKAKLYGQVYEDIVELAKMKKEAKSQYKYWQDKAEESFNKLFEYINNLK